MPKQKQYDDGQSVEVQWSKNGQLVCVVINVDDDTTDKDGNAVDGGTKSIRAMWQATEPDQVNQLIADLKRARKHAFN